MSATETETAEALSIKASIEKCLAALVSPDDPRLRARAIVDARDALDDALSRSAGADGGVPPHGHAVIMPAGIAAWRARITTIDVLNGRDGEKRLCISLGRETVDLQLGPDEAGYLAGLLLAGHKNAAEALEPEAVGLPVADDGPRIGEPVGAGDHDAEAPADPVCEAGVGALQFGDDGLNDDGEVAQRSGLGVHECSSGEGCDDATVGRVGGGGPTGPAGEPAEPPSVPEDIQ